MADVAIVGRLLHVGTAADGGEHAGAQQATDVVIAVAGGAKVGGAVQQGFHTAERAAARQWCDRPSSLPVENRPPVLRRGQTRSHPGSRARTRFVTWVPA